MKKTQALLVVLLLAIGSFSNLQAQELPKPSSSSEVHQRVGLTDFVINYSRPNVREREIFGSLVPYGEVWRTGANAATTIEFSSTVDFAGTKVEAGKYAIYVYPEADSWKIVLNTNWDTWGSNGYDVANDIATFSGKVEKAPFNVESFTIGFKAVNGDDAILAFAWADVMVNISINAPSAELATANINTKLEEISDAYGTYNNVAKYYLGTGNNADALKYAKMSVENAEKFWNVKTLSEAYAANGDIKKAIEEAEKSLKLSQEADYKPYIKMNTDNIAKWKAMK